MKARTGKTEKKPDAGKTVQTQGGTRRKYLFLSLFLFSHAPGNRPLGLSHRDLLACDLYSWVVDKEWRMRQVAGGKARICKFHHLMSSFSNNHLASDQPTVVIYCHHYYFMQLFGTAVIIYLYSLWARHGAIYLLSRSL